MKTLNATVKYVQLTNTYVADAVFEGKLFMNSAGSEIGAIEGLAQKIRDFRDGTVMGYPRTVRIEI